MTLPWVKKKKNNNTMTMFTVLSSWLRVIARVHPVHVMNAEQRRMAADLWTKPTNLSRRPACRLLGDHIHHCQLYYSARKLIGYSFYHPTEGRRLSWPRCDAEVMQRWLTNDNFQHGRHIKRLFHYIKPQSTSSVKYESFPQSLVRRSNKYDVRVWRQLIGAVVRFSDEPTHNIPSCM